MAVSDANERPSPVLQPGRPADPEPAQPPATTSGAQPPATRSAGDSRPPQTTQADETGSEPGEAVAEAGEAPEESPGESREEILLRQRDRRRLLRQCERVLLLDFNTLAMPDWPDNFSLATARRRRDLWLFSASLAAVVFLAGVPGLVPAWVAGSGFGAFVLIALSGVPFIRRLFSSRPSYMDLLLLRQQRLREARSHVSHLEGDEGLAWQCAMMAECNPALRSTRFGTLVNLSEKRVLARQLRRREHIRLYLIFMLEAEKAYDRLQSRYFEGHQLAIDNGWERPDPAADPSEPRETGPEESAESD
ncbi:hypothetical protein EZI54_00045 [Marinobacter halodurans]|uniref:Uncharacterized protein n=1 Tax=Marinobacter halodurans TaxID=2528979 RepID=A0ABY1ZQG6_9GAMM|nr:hypothetical protein [Marinobacter halodurans]TBW59390.1 hypothetical protein EZI54_00045 [Marinobacter halodurans]